MVPTVDREVFTVLVCWMAIDGRMFSIRSIFGFCRQIQKLPGIGAESLDVTALALGMDGVENQAMICPSRSNR